VYPLWKYGRDSVCGACLSFVGRRPNPSCSRLDFFDVHSHAGVHSVQRRPSCWRARLTRFVLASKLSFCCMSGIRSCISIIPFSLQSCLSTAGEVKIFALKMIHFQNLNPTTLPPWTFVAGILFFVASTSCACRCRQTFPPFNRYFSLRFLSESLGVGISVLP
jgi:hypothetical protein